MEIVGLEDIASLKLAIIFIESDTLMFGLFILSVNVTVGELVSKPFNCDASRTLL